MIAVSEISRAQVVWVLKHDGDVSESVILTLRDRLERRGVVYSDAHVRNVLKTLQAQGLVDVARNGSGLLTGVVLVETGSYDDPFDVPVEQQQFAVEQRPAKPDAKRPPKIDRLLSEIARLPLAEKLMLVGLIADGCAGEVDETMTKLRSVLQGI